MEEAASFPFVNQGRKTWSDARAALGNATWEPGVLFHSRVLSLYPQEEMMHTVSVVPKLPKSSEPPHSPGPCRGA